MMLQQAILGQQKKVCPIYPVSAYLLISLEDKTTDFASLTPLMLSILQSETKNPFLSLDRVEP